MYKLIIITLFFSLMTGCTTLSDSVAAKGTGEFKKYESSKADIWPVVVQAVKATDLDFVSESEKSGMILAERGASVFSYGENVAIFVEEESENSCKVEVVSKKSMETNIFAPDWSKEIFENIDKGLKK